MVYEAHYSDGLAALVYLIIEYNMKTGRDMKLHCHVDNPC